MKERIALISDYLRSKPVLKAFLFGSSARGENTANSDIDILLELSSDADLFVFIKMKNELETILNHKIDLVSDKGLSATIKPFIEKDKILIYERKVS